MTELIPASDSVCEFSFPLANADLIVAIHAVYLSLSYIFVHWFMCQLHIKMVNNVFVKKTMYIALLLGLSTGKNIFGYI